VRTPVDQAVWAIVEQDDRTLWLGTSRGLLARSPDGRWRRLSVSSGHLEDDWVTALAVREQSLWVGTYSGGVTRIALATPRGRARALGGGNVNPGGLALVGGTLYAATMDGLRARSTTSGTWSILRSAMLGVDVTAALPAADGLWVASRRGLAFWRPPGVERQ
jgi:hypothetical protein